MNLPAALKYLNSAITESLDALNEIESTTEELKKDPAVHQAISQYKDAFEKIDAAAHDVESAIKELFAKHAEDVLLLSNKFIE